MYKLYCIPLNVDSLNEWLWVLREQQLLVVKLDSHKDKNQLHC